MLTQDWAILIMAKVSGQIWTFGGFPHMPGREYNFTWSPLPPTYNAENPVIAISTEFQKKKNFKKLLLSFNIDLDREME